MDKHVVHLYNMDTDTIHLSLEDAIKWLESTGYYGQVQTLDGIAVVAYLPSGVIRLSPDNQVWR
jgi:hypothetical protein